MLSVHTLWRRYKALRPGDIVILRLHRHIYLAFDEDADICKRLCLGASYVPQVLDEPIEGARAEFRFTWAYAMDVISTLMRHDYKVYLHDVEPCELETTTATLQEVA